MASFSSRSIRAGVVPVAVRNEATREDASKGSCSSQLGASLQRVDPLDAARLQAKPRQRFEQRLIRLTSAIVLEALAHGRSDMLASGPHLCDQRGDQRGLAYTWFTRDEEHLPCTSFREGIRRMHLLEHGVAADNRRRLVQCERRRERGAVLAGRVCACHEPIAAAMHGLDKTRPAGVIA